MRWEGKSGLNTGWPPGPNGQLMWASWAVSKTPRFNWHDAMLFDNELEARVYHTANPGTYLWTWPRASRQLNFWRVDD